MEQEKKCSRCGRILPLSEFYKKTRAKDGHQAYCKKCQAEQNKQKSARKRTSNSLLADFTPRQLIEELRARGYKGTLTYTYKIEI